MCVKRRNQLAKVDVGVSEASRSIVFYTCGQPALFPVHLPCLNKTASRATRVSDELSLKFLIRRCVSHALPAKRRSQPAQPLCVITAHHVRRTSTGERHRNGFHPSQYGVRYFFHLYTRCQIDLSGSQASGTDRLALMLCINCASSCCATVLATPRAACESGWRMYGALVIPAG